jgi:glycosyltransferase involved in cell wall biosynthesis
MTPDRDTPPSPAARRPLLLHVFPSYGAGGVPIRIANIINALGDRYSHLVFALDGNTDAASRLDPALGVAVEDPGIDKARPLAALLKIHRTIAARRPDLMLTYNWGAVEWALVNRFGARRPHIHFESGFGPEEADRQIPRRVWMRRLALGGTPAIVVPSQTLMNIATGIWRIGPRRLRHVPNGVDCDLFGGPGDAATLPGYVRREGEVTVGTLAPLRPEKNIARLLRAFAAAAEGRAARLLVVGDGAERPALERAAAALGIADRVLFAGHVERPDLVYPLFDVFGISSDTEQMPNTVIQAMAASLPVAGTDVGDVKTNLSAENAPFIVPRDDETALAEALRRLIDDAALRRDLAAANRRHVLAHYGMDRMIEAYRALFDGALARSGRG